MFPFVIVLYFKSGLCSALFLYTSINNICQPYVFKWSTYNHRQRTVPPKMMAVVAVNPVLLISDDVKAWTVNWCQNGSCVLYRKGSFCNDFILSFHLTVFQCFHGCILIFLMFYVIQKPKDIIPRQNKCKIKLKLQGK